MDEQNINEPQTDQPRGQEEAGYTPTTTHAERGAGRPRLRVSRDGLRSEFPLDTEVVRIGSAAGNELRLEDTDPVHATITHDERDEYVLTLHGEGEMNANPAAAATHQEERSETLRTGARFTAGPWMLVFARDEHADHGRPYGGRPGGEFSDQPLQAPRPGDADGPSAAETRPEDATSDIYPTDSGAGAGDAKADAAAPARTGSRPQSDSTEDS